MARFVWQSNDLLPAMPDLDVLIIKHSLGFDEGGVIVGSFEVNPLHDMISFVEKVRAIDVHGWTPKFLLLEPEI
jgi:hypothetical protein